MFSFQKHVGTIGPKNNAEWFNRQGNAKSPFGLRCAAVHASQKPHVQTYGVRRSVKCWYPTAIGIELFARSAVRLVKDAKIK